MDVDRDTLEIGVTALLWIVVTVLGWYLLVKPTIPD